MPIESPTRAEEIKNGKTGASFISIVLMNLIVVPLLTVWTLFGIIVFPLVFLIMKILSRRKNYLTMRKIVWYYGQGWRYIISMFVQFKTRDFQRENFMKPCIIVVNHLSFFDTFCMSLLPFYDVCFGVRSWPFRIIVFGPFMRLAMYMDVESYGWEKTLNVGATMLKQKSTVLFFPEGHRSPDGEVKRFYSGAFKLAVETNTPVVPLCITGTDKLLPPGRFWLEPARVSMKTLPVVYPETFTSSTPHVEMRKYVHRMITDGLEEMKRVEKEK